MASRNEQIAVETIAGVGAAGIALGTLAAENIGKNFNFGNSIATIGKAIGEGVNNTPAVIKGFLKATPAAGFVIAGTLAAGVILWEGVRLTKKAFSRR